MTIVNNYGESGNDMERKRESILNIVWLDTGKTDPYLVGILSIFLELTSLHDPHILECAVIITDRNLNELERGQ